MKKSFPECHGLVCVTSEFVPSYYTLQTEENSLLLLNHAVPVCHIEASQSIQYQVMNLNCLVRCTYSSS